MQVATIAMEQEKAREAYAQYKQAVRENRANAQDKAIMLGYRALTKGKTLVNIADAIRQGNLDELGRPRLAIGRADWEQAHFQGYRSWNKPWLRFTNHRSLMSSREVHIKIPWWESPMLPSDRTWRAPTPHIPPSIRPAGDLSKYWILWEAAWDAVPVDPWLLQRIDGMLFVVLAAWDLTELERAVLAKVPLR